MTDYPMTEEEFIKRVSELFMDYLNKTSNNVKEEYLNSEDTQDFMKDLYEGVCGDYEIDGKKDAFSDEMLLQYPVHNLILYF